MAETLPAHDAHRARAVHALDEGALVVLPCAGRYALAADALDDAAVERAFEAKRRPADDAMSVAVASLEEARHVAHVTPLARRLASAFPPGALTLALRARPTAPDALLGGRDVIWIRVPAEALARQIAAEHGPYTATSASSHGAPEARTIDDAQRAIREKASLYLDGGTLPGARATVVDATGDSANVLHAGEASAREVAEAASAFRRAREPGDSG